MIVKAIKTRVFKEGENLFSFVSSYVKKIPEQSIIVVTSKIVALSEGRTAIIQDVHTKERLIRAESKLAIPTKYVWLTIKDGMLMASAGIDESNANGKLILLPKDSFRSASFLRKKLQKRYGIKRLGVLITDSRTIPLRAGVSGIALGYAGFRGLKNYRGALDIFGRKFIFSRVDVADSLAAAAILTMGEGNERRPLAIITKTSVEFCDKIYPRELIIDTQDDMYQPLFARLPKDYL